MAKGLITINSKAFEVDKAILRRNLYESPTTGNWLWKVRAKDGTNFNFEYMESLRSIKMPHLLSDKTFLLPKDDPFQSAHYDRVRLGEDEDIHLWQDLQLCTKGWDANRQLLHVTGKDKRLMNSDSYYESEEEEDVVYVDFEFDAWFEFTGYHLHNFSEHRLDDLKRHLEFFVGNMNVKKIGDGMHVLTGDF